MKLPVNKKWWQFWLPKYVDVDQQVVVNARTPSEVDMILNAKALAGRVVSSTEPPVYDPKLPKKPGGKVYKTMPRQLRKIREAQEKNE